MALEMVTWRDANFEFNPTEMGRGWDYLIQTVGWTSKRGKWLLIDGEKTPEGPRGRTRVPLSDVVKREKLRRK